MPLAEGMTPGRVAKREVPGFLQFSAEQAAPLLLGWLLQTRLDGNDTSVSITEVEAYRSDDPASHSYGGPRGRNLIMFGPPGHLYVYRSYGIHWCVNVVCGPEGEGAAILIRAGQPQTGIDAMRQRRGRTAPLTRGPGNLAQALGITAAQAGVDLFDPASPIQLLSGTPPGSILTTPRIGITKAVDQPWRFVSTSA